MLVSNASEDFRVSLKFSSLAVFQQIMIVGQNKMIVGQNKNRCNRWDSSAEPRDPHNSTRKFKFDKVIEAQLLGQKYSFYCTILVVKVPRKGIAPFWQCAKPTEKVSRAMEQRRDSIAISRDAGSLMLT